ncbi:hypothetical protein GCM10022265_13500 [Marinobacter xestospongiae]
MTMQYFGPALLTILGLVVIYSAAFVTYHVSRSDSLEVGQKRAIVLFVWLVPLIGPTVTAAALGDEFVGQNRKPSVPLLSYIFLGSVFSSAQDQKGGPSHAQGTDSSGGSDTDF